jgi:predicted DNA-binding transcriptional regulator AlpA
MDINTTAEKLLTAQDVGEILSLSKRQVFRMKAAGLICPSMTVGRGACRWRKSDIEKWISMSCCSQKEFVARREAEQC